MQHLVFPALVSRGRWNVSGLGWIRLHRVDLAAVIPRYPLYGSVIVVCEWVANDVKWGAE